MQNMMMINADQLAGKTEVALSQFLHYNFKLWQEQ
jgi:hypothetical protein